MIRYVTQLIFSRQLFRGITGIKVDAPILSDDPQQVDVMLAFPLPRISTGKNGDNRVRAAERSLGEEDADFRSLVLDLHVLLHGPSRSGYPRLCLLLHEVLLSHAPLPRMDLVRQGYLRERWKKWVRNWKLWKYYCDYFPIKLIKLSNLDPKKNYLFACHPHGILCSGAFGNFATEGTNFSKVFPGLIPHLLTLEGHYSIPGYRDFLLCSGSVAASKDSLKYILMHPDGGHAAAVIVGGASESFFCQPGTYRLVLKKRKGFIRIAMQTGRMCTVRYQTLREVCCGIFKRSCGESLAWPLCLGEPIVLKENPNPSPEEVDEVHNLYVQSLVQLFETQKCKYLSDPSTKLIIT
ncbi:hypothetical protein J437_LFUL017186 [Ladona fulva]|uniref:Acyltransferase n=1 Tax=Ladona fulva TaxID=123851 RepID=A0A8K0P8H5_LADFU|nr:hypothetical protein J437_LFUL017186 [Ladona fulva]